MFPFLRIFKIRPFRTAWKPLRRPIEAFGFFTLTPGIHFASPLSDTWPLWHPPETPQELGSNNIVIMLERFLFIIYSNIKDFMET